MPLLQKAQSAPANRLSLPVSLSMLALASLLGSLPSVAATQSPSPTVSYEADPVLVANIFRQIGDAVRDAIDTVDTVDSIFDQITGGRNEAPQPEPPSAPQSATPSPAPATAQSPRPATSQSASNAQVIHRDDSPRQCQIEGGSNRQSSNCEAFQITQGDGVLFFSYYFNGAPISFLAIDEPVQQTDSATGYLVGGLMFGTEYVEMVGSCAVGRVGNQQYQMAVCTTEDDLKFTYLN